MTIPVLFEHEDFVIVHKPIGQLVHGSDDSLIYAIQDQLGLSTPLDPVHRLDKDTSGTIILSKKKHATSRLSMLFQSKQVQKTYTAVTNTKPKKKQGKIVGDMEKSRNGSYKLLREKSSPAITHFFSVAIADGKRLFFLFPKTGKTHQLRVALKAISSPILGDNRYGGDCADRMYLHAYAITFDYLGNTISVSNPHLQGSEWPPLALIEEQLSQRGNTGIGQV